MGRLFTHGDVAAAAAVGVASGLGLYALFWLGEQLLVVVAPGLAAEVGELYAVKGETRPGFVPVVVAVAATGEELFFRGFLQVRSGVVIALAVYAAVHLWERKLILILAALVAGGCWAALLGLTGGIVAPLVSHLVWGLTIIVWHPARPTAWAQRLGVRVRSAAGRR